MAPLAWAHPVAFGLCRSFVEAHVLAQRQARFARRQAIDAHGENTVAKQTILRGVASMNNV